MELSGVGVGREGRLFPRENPTKLGVSCSIVILCCFVLFAVESFQPLDVEEDGVSHLFVPGCSCLLVLPSWFSGCFLLKSSICSSNLSKALRKLCWLFKNLPVVLDEESKIMVLGDLFLIESLSQRFLKATDLPT